MGARGQLFDHVVAVREYEDGDDMHIQITL